MKKILLGTTALVTAGLLAGPALASDPLKVTISGNVVAGFYLIDSDNVDGTKLQDTKVSVVARNIDIKAEGTLDNGIVAGVDAKLQLGNDWSTSWVNDSNNNGSPYASFRQLFAYLEGGFGKFEIGGTDGASYKMHYTSPWFVPGNGVDSPNVLNSVAANYGIRQSTFSLLATDSNKVSYFTPRLAGFQLGASFTPDATIKGPSENGLGLTSTDETVHNVFEVALNYAGTLSGVDVGADVFYTTGDAPSGSQADPEEYGAGLNLGYAGFTLGGAYYKGKDIYTFYTPEDGFDTRTWTVGLKYATGPWTVGVAYLTNDQDYSYYYAGTTTTSTWQLGGGYNLGSGVDLGLDLQATKIDPDSGSSIDAKSAGLVLAIAF